MQKFTVQPAVLTVMADDQTKVYLDPVPKLTASITGFVRGDLPGVVTGEPTLNTSAVAASNVGGYPIEVGIAGLSAANYTFRPVNGTLTITKASQTIDFGSFGEKFVGDPSF